MIPDEFQGAWRRVTLALDGGDEQADADALWLQATDDFADLRVDRTTGRLVSCFAGTTTWDPPWLRWSHAVDVGGAGVAATDESRVTWDDDDLVERGVYVFPGTDGPVRYVERWRRMPDDRPVRSLILPDGVLVEAGRHALEIVRLEDTISATYRQRSPAGWQTERCFRQ